MILSILNFKYCLILALWKSFFNNLHKFSNVIIYEYAASIPNVCLRLPSLLLWNKTGFLFITIVFIKIKILIMKTWSSIIFIFSKKTLFFFIIFLDIARFQQSFRTILLLFRIEKNFSARLTLLLKYFKWWSKFAGILFLLQLIQEFLKPIEHFLWWV